jgi:hypothetical protein
VPFISLGARLLSVRKGGLEVLTVASRTIFDAVDAPEACGCSGSNASDDERREIDHVVLPFVLERKGGPLVAFTQFHWDMQPKARAYSNHRPLPGSLDSSREGSPVDEGGNSSSVVEVRA